MKYQMNETAVNLHRQAEWQSLNHPDQFKLSFVHKIREVVNPHRSLIGQILQRTAIMLIRTFLIFPPVIKVNPANAADGIGDRIHDVGLPGWNKILMDLIADSVKGSGPDAD